MRELKRNIARTNMKDYGIKHINKHIDMKGTVERPDGSRNKPSFFASYWRKWVAGVPR